MCFVALESVALSRVASASAGWPSARRGSCVVQSDCFTPAFSSRMDTTPSPHSTQEGARRSTTPPLAELGSSQRSTTTLHASAFAPLSADELGASQQLDSNIADPLVASRVLPQGSTFNSAVSTTRCSATPPSHASAARVAFTSPLAAAAAGSGVASSGFPALSTAARAPLPASPPLAESALDATVAATLMIIGQHPTLRCAPFDADSEFAAFILSANPDAAGVGLGWLAIGAAWLVCGSV